MQTAFRLGYSLVVAILFVLFVILGIRTFYDEPESPSFQGPATFAKPLENTQRAEPLFCQPDGRCFKGGREITSQDEASLTEEERPSLQQQRGFYAEQRSYEDERADYH